MIFPFLVTVFALIQEIRHEDKPPVIHHATVITRETMVWNEQYHYWMASVDHPDTIWTDVEIRK